MGWQNVFGPEYDVPEGIAALVRAGIARDVSTKKNHAPTFEADLEPDHKAVLWSGHPDSGTRGKSPRFVVSAVDADGAVNYQYMGNEPHKAVEAFKGLIEKYGIGR